MPTYEYECKTCNKIFDVFQSMTEEPLSVCPDCGGKVKRLIGTGAGIIFKGSGFYQTDYRSSDYKSKAQKDQCTSCCDTKKETPACGKSDKKCCSSE